MRALIGLALALAPFAGGCAVAKVTGEAAALPFKGAYHGTRLAGQGVYYAGKGAFYTGRGAYEVGKVPVRVADGVFDTSTKVLTLTILTLNTAGHVSSLSRDVAAGALYTELAAIDRSSNVLEVLVEVAS